MSRPAQAFSDPLPPELLRSPGESTGKKPRTPLSRLRLSELEAAIRRRWLAHATEATAYPETLVRALLLSGAQPQETVWQEAVTAALKTTLRAYHEAGLTRAGACMKLNELAICISAEVSSTPLDLVSAATLIEVANGALLDLRHQLWEEAVKIPSANIHEGRIS
jgi:hypothetical protein